MEAIPSDRLVRLLSLMEKNIRAAEKMSLVGDPVRTFFLFSSLVLLLLLNTKINAMSKHTFELLDLSTSLC